MSSKILELRRGTWKPHPLGTQYVTMGALRIASAYDAAGLETLRISRRKYDRACAKARELYQAGKSHEWWLACNEARLLSKTIPLTVAKGGKVADGDDDGEE